ncbi:MAG: hypothetical protein NXI23_21010 [Bacteroidetes bacterium]|nr:hypothetical protein [Bacteroidota bacterium]
MNGKKILIVSVSFYPENSPRSFRTTELVKEFCRQGHQVTLATIYKPEHHDALIKEFNFKILDLGERKFTQISVRKNRILNIISRLVRRMGLYLFEYPNIELMFKVKTALQNISGFDLMISIAVPHPIHWGVSRARTDSHKIADTWVADCGDPYMGISYDRFGKAPHFKYVEKAFCRKADFISVPIEAAKKAYYSEFRNKIKVIPQGFKFEDVWSLLEKYKSNEIPTFIYAGNFIPGRRDIRPVLDFLLSTGKDFKFFIYTKSTGFITPYLNKASDKIILSSFIPRTELLPLLSKMDFLMNLENGVTEQVPSKLIDYSLIGRPILSIDSQNIDKSKVLAFLEGNYEEQFPKPDINQYKIENICSQFLALTKKE